jgi:hypothetical protein
LENTTQLSVKRVPLDAIHQDPSNVRLHDSRNLEAEDAMEGVGYSDEDLAELTAGLKNEVPEVIEDEVPGLPDAATTRRGDVWIIGRHRLMCGDSALAEDVDRLLAGTPIHLVNPDPPYNVKVEPRSNNAIAAGLSSFTTTHHQGLDLARHPSKAQPTHEKLRPKDRPLANDFVWDEEFARMLRAWFGNIARVLLPGRALYCWGGYSNIGNYPSAPSPNPGCKSFERTASVPLLDKAMDHVRKRELGVAVPVLESP